MYEFTKSRIKRSIFIALIPKLLLFVCVSVTKKSKKTIYILISQKAASLLKQNLVDINLFKFLLFRGVHVSNIVYYITVL